MLPTPTRMDGNGSRNRTAERSTSGAHDGVTLTDAVWLLPTPMSSDPQGGPRAVPERRTHRGPDHSPRLRDVAPLLPTPRHLDGQGYGTVAGAEGGPDLRDAAALLPTPNATHGRPNSRTGPLLDGIDQLLPTPRTTEGQIPNRWGRYQLAIERWEAVTGHPAPEPTVPGTKGQPTLNPRLSEWLMGLPPGWLDVPGVSASAQKAIAGNGVVQQQAEMALRLLLGGAA